MPRGVKEMEGEDSQAEGADEQGQEEEGIGAEDKEKGAEAEAGKAEEEIGATRAREAKERDDASLAERIRYGKKGSAAAAKIHVRLTKRSLGTQLTRRPGTEAQARERPLRSSRGITTSPRGRRS